MALEGWNANLEQQMESRRRQPGPGKGAWQSMERVGASGSAPHLIVETGRVGHCRERGARD